MVKQVIVVRKDLNMRKGKIGSQVAHASMKIFFDRTKAIEGNSCLYLMELTEEMKEWKDGLFAKIVVEAGNEEELLMLYQRARESGLPVSLITDAGLTEFHGVPTNTCIAIGPAQAEAIDAITGGLKLM